MELNVIIERAALEDAKEILDLQKLAYQSEAEIYDDDTIPPLTQTLEEVRNDFERQTFLKASMGGRIIGSVRAFLKEETCFIGRLIVHPDFQNQGIGIKLMNEVERHFSRAERFELFTGQKSDRNIHLYQKLGYQVFKTETVTKELKLLYMEKAARRIP
jgi:ribosomal protein S18 acetylase RimI-like enzyme